MRDATSAGRIHKALEIAAESAMFDGDHHKMWVIDQMVRALTGCPVETRTGTTYLTAADTITYQYEAQGESPQYQAFVAAARGWDEGIAP